ncbi:MAG: hypothetical protein KF797_01200 [Flavobacteriales bacterium]|nr:hypothetical protein [Flavobacteriales bacterium]
MLCTLFAKAQGDQQVRAKADGLFNEKSYVETLPLYSQLVSLAPADRVLNYKFGTCLLFGGTDKDKAIGHLKFATQDPSIPPDAWYWLGRAYHLSYQFKDALTAYQRYQGTGSKKELEGFPIAALDKQCRNGMNLLSNLKEITVHSRVEADDTEFFRFYELGDIGGKIVVLPEELKTPLDKKSKRRTLVYLPEKGGPIYYASYGKDGKTGLDIYRTELLSNGTFATPVKLAGYVNTDQDEDYAFLHPDGRNFYFSSKGHNSMGGYDVFRSAYDKVSETFGPPENLDFAVNTPDDDVFYMTDAENKQACFASARGSKQGKLHVYRVATAQVPVVVTVMKGTYASAFDQNDRKAHIMVEDAVTRERVANVRTDINGSYVLALPRSGKFRYLVECGPTGRTHTGVVDVPRATSARAFRQELELTRKGDQEELVIRNYFDTPLEEDMIALMMDEIKRRARLDVTGDRPAATEQPAPEPAGDVLTQAGFSGDVTEAKAVQLAKDDARGLEDLTKALDGQSAAAYIIAKDAATAAEQAAREATVAAEKANAATDEATRNALMKEAAQLRQQSRTVNLRARAAYHAAQGIDAERMAVQQRANTAARLATDLEQAVATGKQETTLAHLRTLKERLDTKAGPEGDVPLAERTRRTLAEQEKEAARRMSMATAKRAEETELADRIERAKRERDAAKNKARKDELSRTIAEQEQQLAYLHAEVEGAFNTAREHEMGTAVMRGQHSLTHHLSTQPASGGSKAPTKEEIAGLGQRIAGNDSRIASIPVDARFDGNFAEPASAVEARSFNWQLAGPDAVLAAGAVPTQSMARDGRNDAVHADGRTATIPARSASGEVRSAEVPDVPVSTGDELVNAGRTIGEVREDAAVNDPSSAGTASGGQASGRAQNSDAHAAGTTEGTSATDVAAAQQRIQPVGQGNSGTASGSTQHNEARTVGEGASTGTTATDVATSRQQGNAVDGQQTTGSTTRQNPNAHDLASAGISTAAGTDAVDAQGERHSASSTDAGEAAQSATADASSSGDTFLLENEKAELQQAIAAERNAARRDELRARLSVVEQRLSAAATQADEAEAAESEMSIDGVDMQRTPITFFPTTKDNDIITLVYPNYESDKRKLGSLSDPVARAEGLSGLELMLADSLRGEMVRQAAVLELAPQQGANVLPKIERLRLMRQTRIQEADRITREAAAAGQLAEETPREGLSRTASRATYPAGQNPVTDRFIFIPDDRQEVYTSKVEHRSPKVAEAVAAKDADLERMRSLDDRIDAIEVTLEGLPRKEYEKKRREADKLIDERMILRTELGQRSAFLTKEEWRTAADSLKGIDKRVTALGLAPNESLLLMSQGMRTNATTRYAEAEAMRKRADRSEDIMLRDSLLRSAYGMELEALHEMDRSITVKTYLLGDQFKRGESLAYDEVARRVLGITDEPVPAIASSIPTGRADAADGRVAVTGEEARVATTDPDVQDGATVTAIQERPTPVDRSETVDGQQATNTAGEGSGTMDPRVTDAAPNTSEADAAAIRRAREEAIALAERTEGTLPHSARAPAQLYENYLTGETVMLKVEALDPALDSDLLSIRKEQAARESAELEQRSLALTDRAAAMEDSATTARKRDRERLELLAIRTRAEADSLHDHSLVRAEDARALELQQRDAAQAKQLRDRLVKYYYLSGEEQTAVLDDQDLSRYFQMKARALEQLDAAADAEASARANRQLGEVLRKEADAVRAGEAGGTARREVLYGRAEMLSARADSLSNIAARLRGAANINESQAGVILQGMPADRSTEWMAMEMRTRRTELMLAQAEQRTPVVASQEQGRGGSVAANERERSTPAGSAPPTRNIAPPFGTDQRSERPAVARPIAEIPAANAPEMVFPEVLVNDMFEFRPTGERKPAAIAMDARLPSGIVFKVQIGAFRSPISEENFSDMTPVMGEHTPNGFIRYTAGLFTGFQQAARAKDRVRDRGYRDAFVVAYRDGVRIPLGEAMREARAAEQGAIAANAPAGAPPATATGGASGAGRTASTVASTPPTATASGVAREPGNTVLEPVRTSTGGTEPSAVLIQRPLDTPAAPVPAPAVTTEQILAKYPATAEAIVGSFVPEAGAADYYNVPGAAPAAQVETIKGLFYTVQVGVYSKPVALDKLFNLTQLNSERTETAKIRYTTGRYTDPEQARVRKDQSVALGVKDAFVTAYLNGKRIPMQEAAALLQQFGTEILARP